MADVISATGEWALPRATWRGAVKKYVAIARINLLNRLTYIWDTASNSLLMFLFIFIFAQLWGATFEAQGTAVISGLTLNQTVWYFVWAEMIQMGKIRHVQTVSQEVKDGSLAYTLGRPYNYLLYHFFAGFGAVSNAHYLENPFKALAYARDHICDQGPVKAVEGLGSLGDIINRNSDFILRDTEVDLRIDFPFELSARSHNNQGVAF